MATEREFLISKGLAKPGRGRFSAAAKAEIEKAINAGVKFDDPTGKIVIVVSKDEEGNEVQTTKRIADVPEVPDPRPDRPDGEYVFINPDGSSFRRSHANACAKCLYSFQWCYCISGPVQTPYPYAGGDVYATLDMVITTTDVPGKQPTQGVPPRKGRRKGK